MRILVTGATGLIGRALCAAWVDRHELWGTSRRGGSMPPGVTGRSLVLEDQLAPERLVREVRPDWIVHLAARTDPDACESDPQTAAACNVEGTRRMAQAATAAGCALLYASTDLVFDGRCGLYREDDIPRPLSTYGRTKLEGERPVLENGGCVLRIALTYGSGRGRRESFSEMILRSLRQGRRPRLFRDQYRTHLYVEDIAPCIEALLACGYRGTVHLGGGNRTSRYDFGVLTARLFGLDPAGPEPIALSESGLRAARPADTSLVVDRLVRVTGLQPRGDREGLLHQRGLEA